MTVKIAVIGRALVDPCAKAIEFTHIKTKVQGAGNKSAVTTMHCTQLVCFICLKRRTDVYPLTKDVRQYRTTHPAKIDPRRVVEIIPVSAKHKWKKVVNMS